MINATISLAHCTIAYKTWGSPEKPPVLAIHGWQDNANSFDFLAEYLQDHCYLIAIDLPGHGLSSHLPPGCHYHFIDGVFTIVQIIEALNIGRVHLLGHSLGACLASIVAGIAPHLILSLSLIEALGPFSAPEDTAATQLEHFVTTLTPTKKNTPRMYRELEQAIKIRAAKGYVSQDIAAKLGARGIAESDGRYYWRHDRRLMHNSPLYLTERQILSCLQRIEAHTLLLWAKQGIKFNATQMSVRMQQITHLTVISLDGGHHIHMEQPQPIASLLMQQFYQAR